MLLDDVVAALSAALANVAPTGFGSPDLAAVGSPPRYVIVPGTIDDGQALGARKATTETRIRNDRHLVSAHCWGATIADCQRMRQALLTIARDVEQSLSVRVYATGASEWGRESWCTSGLVLTVPIVVELALVAAALPAALGGDPKDTVTDLETTTATITKVSFDPKGVPGDGRLSAAGEG